MNNEYGHSILCAWPYRPCAALCGVATERTSPKFSSALAERLWTFTLESGQDDDLGDESFGWFDLFKGENAILMTDDQGFVDTVEFVGTVTGAWAGIETAWHAHHVRTVVDALDTSECDELFSIVNVNKIYTADGLPDMDEIAEHINVHRECWQRNAWTLEV
ncbi:hypothetical protein [Streptomyces halobius]|uniref:Immunity protein 8 of polymorphic toxin system n=1 Tax=Streptomyces halobius TaxID=2879846 RepID=A0ABY4M384_9ACTN|nr:hypothetical protein [Streptomyces halobius]UQA91648.1 hypothetical protein K9S39_07035 [Streptomyces halobius]